jgi:hypothetical protein
LKKIKAREAAVDEMAPEREDWVGDGHLREKEKGAVQAVYRSGRRKEGLGKVPRQGHNMARRKTKTKRWRWRFALLLLLMMMMLLP